MHNYNSDDVILDHLGSTFSFRRPEPEGGLQILDGATGKITRGRYCRVQLVEETDGYSVEMKGVSIHTSEGSADELRDHVTAEPEGQEFEFYCSALNHFDLAEDIRDEYWCYPANGCDVTFYWDGEDEGEEYDPEKEMIVLTTHQGKISFMRKDAKVFKQGYKYYLGSIFQLTEISESLHKVLASSNRATAITTEETEAFGKVDFFSLHGAPTREDMMTNDTIIEKDDTDTVIDF